MKREKLFFKNTVVLASKKKKRCEWANGNSIFDAAIGVV